MADHKTNNNKFQLYIPGVSAIRGQTLTMGGYLRSHLDLPPSCRIGERISVRLTCVNRGSATLKRAYEIASVPGEGTFDFLTQDGARMVSLNFFFFFFKQKNGNSKNLF